MAEDTNGSQDIYVRDREADTIERASLDSDGNQTPQFTFTDSPAISASGRQVAFSSFAALVAGDTNGVSDVFVRDLDAGTTERVSIGAAEQQANGESFKAPISGDGDRVAFLSAARNLAANDRNGGADVFVRDRAAGATERASVDSEERPANRGSFNLAISQDGRSVAFDSAATRFGRG